MGVKMTGGIKKIKYIEIAEELMEEIRSGKFKAGDKLYSRSQLAAKYNIGAITAVRVQDYLADRSYVRKVHGGGIYVNYDKDSLSMKVERQEYPKIRKIIELRMGYSRRVNFSLPFFHAIDQIVAERKLSYQLHQYSVSEISEASFNTLDLDPDAGYLILGTGPLSMMYSAAALINPNVHNVLMDGIIPGCNCVLTDSFDGIGKIVDYAVESGVRNFVFAKNYARQLGDLYNEERTYAAQYHTRRRGFDCTVVESGSYDGLMELVKSSGEKTAFLFPQDEPACRFGHLLTTEQRKNILLAGFDDFPGFETALPRLVTIRPDQEKIVRTAIDILCGEHTYRKRIVRIPGTLIVKEA